MSDRILLKLILYLMEQSGYQYLAVHDWLLNDLDLRYDINVVHNDLRARTEIAISKKKINKEKK